MRVKRKKKKKRGFFFKLKKKIFNIKKKTNLLSYNNYFLQKKINLNEVFLKNLKEGNLNYFLKLPEKITEEQKKNLKIFAYDNKIKMLNLKRFNLGFLDFLIYIFFKINMIKKVEEEEI